MEINPLQKTGLCGLTGKERPALLNGLAEDSAEPMTDIQRDYLAEVYRLHADTEEPVTTTALAEKLAVSPPAVVRMMQRLAKDGYLRREPYRGVVLTPAGEREALKAVRRHRLLEVFLVKVMGYGWDEAHDPAHRLQAALTDDFEDRMERVAGYPRYCPHGEPIPTKEGLVETLNDQPLPTAPDDTPLTLRRVKAHEADRLRYLGEMGLYPGATLRIVGRAPFGGPLRVRVGAGRLAPEHVLGAELARELRVTLAG